GLKVGRGDLAVDHYDAGGLCGLDQTGEGDLRSIRLAAEHRFPEEHLAELDTVETANQLRSLPGLEAVRIAELMERLIGLDHLGREPGADIRLARRGTFPDYRAEISVDARFEA